MKVLVVEREPGRVWIKLNPNEFLDTAGYNVIKVWAHEDFTELCIEAEIVLSDDLKGPEIVWELYIPSMDWRFASRLEQIGRARALQILGLSE